ncbi:Alkanesulfonate monooxygenase [Raoultella planticola]|uniref:Alkanesulfonate monooxygenase n=1 Tax=Raoultella planticola TaxID=575 RepID=A0A485AKH1_RAOPL|nr:Alkanesulfonate monooxygenase [Raoultella planticola]
MTATISCALRKLTKRPASIACWWGIGPISRMAFWLPRWPDYPTEKISFLLAHRPGFVSPTLAARKFATLEHLLGGRLAVHIISGGNDAEQRRDGDYLNHDQRYARTDAFLDTVRKVWTAEQPVDIDNDFYQAEQAWSAIRPLQQPHIPIYFGGSSRGCHCGGR